ncbi:MAG: AAA family ATPase [Sneathiella sp.]
MMRIRDYTEADEALVDISAFVLDEQSEKELERCFNRLGFPKHEITRGDVHTAIKRYSQAASPSILIVDISRSEMPLSDMEALANVCAPNIQVIVIGTCDTVGLYRNLLRYGISDYLIKPIPQAMLYSALSHMKAGENHHPAEVKTGKVVSVYGASGGIGTTSLLCALGDILSREENRRVMLVDLDILQGDTALHFGLSAGAGFSNLLRSPERADDLVLERLSLSVNKKLNILCSEGESEDSGLVDSKSIGALTDSLRQKYHFILHHIPDRSEIETLPVLMSSDICILILEPGLTGLRNARNLLQKIKAYEMVPQIIAVLNNSRPSFKSSPTAQQIEKFIGHPLEQIIPYDGKGFNQSSLDGVPVSRNNSRASQKIKLLAASLVGSKPQAKSPFLKLPFKFFGG